MNLIDKDIKYVLSEIVNDGFMLPPCSKVSATLLSAFLVSEEFKAVYEKYILEYYPHGEGIRKAINALKKYRHLEEVDFDEYRDTILDLIYTKNVLGFYTWEYFAYGLENKSIEEKLAFLKNENIFRYYKTMNQDSHASHTLLNKYQAYQLFRDFFKREMIQVRTAADKETLRSFCFRHNSFILKPVGESMGKGIRLINTEDYYSFEELYADLNQDATFVCEELITPHESFVQVNPGCVNTVRIFTYNNGTDVRIVCAWMKAGRGNAVVDNAGAGGMIAAIDENTGIVVTGAADEMGGEFPVHPETGFVFEGFQIPYWDDALSLVKSAAPRLPGVPMIGWDLALSADKGWQIIEGNNRGQVNLIQIPYKKGMLDILTERFDWANNRQHSCP